jgi:hypothetical protein
MSAEPNAITRFLARMLADSVANDPDALAEEHVKNDTRLAQGESLGLAVAEEHSTREAMHDAGLPDWERLSPANAIRELARQRDEARLRLREHEEANVRLQAAWTSALAERDEARRAHVRLHDAGEVTSTAAVVELFDNFIPACVNEARLRLREYKEGNVRLQSAWKSALADHDVTQTAALFDRTRGDERDSEGETQLLQVLHERRLLDAEEPPPSQQWMLSIDGEDVHYSSRNFASDHSPQPLSATAYLRPQGYLAQTIDGFKVVRAFGEITGRRGTTAMVSHSWFEETSAVEKAQ